MNHIGPSNWGLQKSTGEVEVFARNEEDVLDQTSFQALMGIATEFDNLVYVYGWSQT